MLDMETDASSSTLRGSKGHEGRAADPHSEENTVQGLSHKRRVSLRAET